MIGFSSRLLLAAASLFALAPMLPAQQAEPWATYRGNSERTANTDGQPGPKTPKVLWVLKSKDHYIASPVPVGERLFVSGLGAFNLGNLACLATAPAVKQRTLWAKTSPFLKLPTVSSPAIFKNYLFFGDGMHQTSGARLYCLESSQGAPVWRHTLPGELVHLEGSPTILDGKAYIGGGAAGVVCLEAGRATIDGETHVLGALQQIMAVHWKKLLAKYEIDRKKDPTFTIPPSEDQLPHAEPKRLWQQGQEKWHVDAPVTVVGDKVLVASAYLTKEQVGDRALFCLDAKTGNILWRTPLKLNPWGGPSVHGDTVIVSGSSIGYDYNALKGAKGFIAAYHLGDGKQKWLKDITGGVVACAALSGDAAVVTATDGKVRAFALDTGERQWIYDAKMPLFAPVAIAGNVVYAGDLRGTVHALELKTGAGHWKLDLGTHPGVQAPGMIYGGPVVQGGRVYVATCNLQGPNANQPTVVVCLGE